jgi:hypothetical protein
MVHTNKAFRDTFLVWDLKVDRAEQDLSVADFEGGDLAKVGEETGRYLGVFEHNSAKVRQSKCHRKRMLELEWEDIPPDME